MTDFHIDDDVPMIPRNKYPFSDMKVGQSFFVSGDEDGNRASAAARVHQYKGGWKFSQRKVVENGVSGVRIWRVE